MQWLQITNDIARLAPLPDREAQVGCYLLALQQRWGSRIPWNSWQAAAITGLWRAEVERGLAGLIDRGLVQVDEQWAA